jgi:hypothetical protein
MKVSPCVYSIIVTSACALSQPGNIEPGKRNARRILPEEESSAQVLRKFYETRKNRLEDDLCG